MTPEAFAQPSGPADAYELEDRYRLASRERRGRGLRAWWVLALLVALLLGAFTFAAREIRDVGAAVSSSGAAVARLAAD